MYRAIHSLHLEGGHLKWDVVEALMRAWNLSISALVNNICERTYVSIKVCGWGGVGRGIWHWLGYKYPETHQQHL